MDKDLNTGDDMYRGPELAGIRPRNPDELRALEAKVISEEQQKEAAHQQWLARHGGGALGMEPATRADIDRVAGAFSQYVSSLEATLAPLLASRAQLTEEDVELIKAHVRHPGAIEAAKLRERIRCALLALATNATGAATRILEAEDAKG